MIGRAGEGGKGGGRDLPSASSDACKGQGWTRPKPGGRNSTQVSHRGSRAYPAVTSSTITTFTAFFKLSNELT